MAKADPKVITWVSLRDAKTLVTEAYGSPQLAERLLLEWLKNGKVRWSCKFIEGRVPKSHPLMKRDQGAPFWGEASFWRDVWLEGATQCGALVEIGSALHVNWDESWARHNHGREHVTPHKIVVPRDDLLALLPQEQEHAGFGAAKVWVVSEARRLKVAGEIPAGIRKTKLAQLLADKMCEAAKRDPSIRPVQWRYIANMLQSWGLWPVSSIK
jgi:hypothetical protein